MPAAHRSSSFARWEFARNAVVQETRRILAAGDPDTFRIPNTPVWRPTRWKHAFMELFFLGVGKGSQLHTQQDDLLFFVLVDDEDGSGSEREQRLTVRRKGSAPPPELQEDHPAGDGVNWRASVQLNLVLQSSYLLSIATCGRDLLGEVGQHHNPPPGMYQVVTPIYASPMRVAVNLDSSRAAAAAPVQAYPDICFALDAFDETVHSMVLQDPGQCFAVVLSVVGGPALQSAASLPASPTSAAQAPRRWTSATRNGGSPGATQPRPPEKPAWQSSTALAAKPASQSLTAAAAAAKPASHSASTAAAARRVSQSDTAAAEARPASQPAATAADRRVSQSAAPAAARRASQSTAAAAAEHPRRRQGAPPQPPGKQEAAAAAQAARQSPGRMAVEAKHDPVAAADVAGQPQQGVSIWELVSDGGRSVISVAGPPPEDGASDRVLERAFSDPLISPGKPQRPQQQEAASSPTAPTADGVLPGVIVFSGYVSCEQLQDVVYSAHSRAVHAWAGKPSDAPHRVVMRGPGGKGFADVAVAALKRKLAPEEAADASHLTSVAENAEGDGLGRQRRARLLSHAVGFAARVARGVAQELLGVGEEEPPDLKCGLMSLSAPIDVLLRELLAIERPSEEED